MSGKEPTVLQSLHSTEARALCLRGPSPDETQKTFTIETHLEETPQNSVCDIRACSRGPRDISSGSTVQDATLLQMDSLEETLQELETTLSELSTKSTMPCPGSPQSLRPHPQVATTPSSPLLSSCSSLWACRVGEQDHRSAAHLPHPTVYISAYHALGAFVQARPMGRARGGREAGPPRTQLSCLGMNQGGSVPVCSL